MSTQHARKPVAITAQPTLQLNDERVMPQLGLGVWQVPDAEGAVIVGAALNTGYRLIDTAAIYKNERGVGQGIAQAGLPREELFITTKLWNDDQGYDSALNAFDQSLKLLGLDYVDLYLIHWPVPKKGKYVESWKALIELKKQGRARSIGVSNFKPAHLERMIGESGVMPAVNQVELHPKFQQRALRAFHAEKGIVTESWSPLGQGKLMADKTIMAIAKRLRRTPAQVILRWHLDSGLIPIPKSANSARIAENFDVFGFRLGDEDMQTLNSLDSPKGRIGPDPDDFN
jgi:2,5-diketo-D-gluconate reductase A